MLSENKFYKYLLYAIGEIALVMIGILLALQVNNWNEKRKASEKEVASLTSLKSELMSSLDELRQDHKGHMMLYQSTLDVHHYVSTNQEETDSMYQDFFNMIRINYFFPKTSTYETLKSGNLEIITSDTLRALITDVYETGYERLRIKAETRRNAGRLLFPYYQKHFRTQLVIEDDKKIYDSINKNVGIPNDYQRLIHDPEFETLIAEAIHGRTNINNDYIRTTQLVEDCIAAIDRYLSKKEN
jgi:hypothetical protein